MFSGQSRRWGVHTASGHLVPTYPSELPCYGVCSAVSRVRVGCSAAKVTLDVRLQSFAFFRGLCLDYSYVVASHMPRTSALDWRLSPRKGSSSWVYSRGSAVTCCLVYQRIVLSVARGQIHTGCWATANRPTTLCTMFGWVLARRCKYRVS
jgi:hypothetical protein